MTTLNKRYNGVYFISGAWEEAPVSRSWSFAYAGSQAELSSLYTHFK